MRNGKTFRRMTVVLAAAFALAGGAVVTTGSPAMAACSDTGCNGLDPQSAGCSSGAQTIDDFVAPNGYYLELRYSPTCYAVWVRVNSQGYWDSSTSFWVERKDTGGRYSNTFVSGESGSKWTKMWSYRYLVRGGETVNSASVGNLGTFYTAWH
ncbi:DUF2690 domain-containing protein [Micromonospora narathiwatensis]|uniref:DUF2690 domain-containing protein n=1 Tax=Micromonospora narathiwatensis TaxID=299146 RepID=A0A1A8ZBM6_9ACTN|nr:DUF2690 domain-containing protein [Micromonospora narathiwatensis]SBT41277.1 Protein of unknown function (DUF2690) [Micromonospora narathiwatensis]